jgi:hypothetical protein
MRGDGEVLLRESVEIPRAGSHRWTPGYISDGAVTTVITPFAVVCGILVYPSFCLGH